MYNITIRLCVSYTLPNSYCKRLAQTTKGYTLHTLRTQLVDRLGWCLAVATVLTVLAFLVDTHTPLRVFDHPLTTTTTTATGPISTQHRS